LSGTSAKGSRSDIQVGKKSSSRLLTLPLELRVKIWKLVLCPTVVFSVEPTEPQSPADFSRFLFDTRRDYYQSLVNFYIAPEGEGDRHDLRECNNVSYQKHLKNMSLMLVNRQVFSEATTIIHSFSGIIAGGFLTGQYFNMFRDYLEKSFLTLLLNSKVYFNCRIYEFYAFFDAGSPEVLRNITSIVLGEALLTNPTVFGRNDNILTGGFHIARSRVNPWESEERGQPRIADGGDEPRILRLIKTQLPALKEVALWAPTSGRIQRGEYCTIAQKYMCQMLTDGDLDVLHFLYPHKLGVRPAPLNSNHHLDEFFDTGRAPEQDYQDATLSVTRVDGLYLDNSMQSHSQWSRFGGRELLRSGPRHIMTVFTLRRARQGIALETIAQMRQKGLERGLMMSTQERDEAIAELQATLAGLVEAKVQRDF
jgi:hypothetical protein